MTASEVAEPESLTYTLRFPTDLDADQVVAWLHSLSGLLPGIIGRLFGAPTVVCELRASAARGFEYRLMVPRSHADYVAGQLRTAVPGVRVTPDKEIAPAVSSLDMFRDALRASTSAGTAAASSSPAWTHVAEFGMRRLTQTLRVAPVPVASSVLASLQGFALQKGEVSLVQWVIRPAVPERPPAVTTPRRGRMGSFFTVSPHVPVKDTVADQRAKLMSDSNFLVCLRIAAYAGSEARAAQLLGSVQTALKSTRTTANTLYVRTALQSSLRRAIDEAKVPLLFGLQLTAEELTGLLAWPIGSPHVAGLPQARSRQLPPSGAIPERGLVVCRASFPGAERPLAISPKLATTHCMVTGPTGTGKTTLLSNLVAQAVAAKSPVIVIEAKADLFRASLQVIPEHRMDDVIVVDVADPYQVSYNLLSEGNRRVAAEGVAQLFEHLFPDIRRGVWARAALHRGLATLITRPGTTLPDLVPLLSPTARSETEQLWREELIAEVQDPELAGFWRRFDGELSRAQQSNYVAPILDRLWVLTERPEIRNLIAQSESSFSMRDVIRERKILLVNLVGAGDGAAGLVGSMLLNSIWTAIRSGAADPDRPTYLFLDEFQDYLNLPVDPENMLVRSRSYGLAMVLAHQHLEQLPTNIRSAAFANARSKIVFQTTYDDARVFAREYGRSVTEDDFLNLGAYEVLARLATEDGVSPPVSGVTFPPIEPMGFADEVRRRSRARYGRAPAAIQADIARRRTPRNPAAPKKRPKLGGVKWE